MKRAWATRIGRAMLLAMMVVSFSIGYLISPRDYHMMRAFADDVRRWDHACDFRVVCFEYSERGSAATAATLAWVPVGKWVLWLRSLPGLPRAWAATETSAGHYHDFIDGPLTAYLHMADVQGVRDVIPVWQDLARTPDLSHDHLRAAIAGILLDRPPTTNDSAVRSLGTLLDDIDAAGAPMTHLDPPGVAIRSHLPALLDQLGIDRRRASSLTVSEQTCVLYALDDHIRAVDPELWRTKQVADFLSGVWGQSYGHEYLILIDPLTLARPIGQALLPVLLLIGIVLRVRSRAAPDATDGTGGAVASPVGGSRVYRSVPRS
ncbi:MAG TPA: hypothetical protein PKB10_11465 [Tepidisphaeraceae bacterium]|nr:hypothetical protein [Tepidisphaeraceae bacterium]